MRNESFRYYMAGPQVADGDFLQVWTVDSIEHSGQLKRGGAPARGWARV
jgi:hypothetical protein